jgi:tetratricopeptide (TPR) repeat protein
VQGVANERGVVGDAGPEKAIFISRAGADQVTAAVIGRILKSAGYVVTLQQWDFARANFMKKIHDALTAGGRVVAILSPEYLASPYCEAEWMNTLAEDPLNEKRRLVVLRIADCKPQGLLAGIDYADLVPVLNDRARLRQAVYDAVLTDHRSESDADGSSHADSEAIYAVPSFTGREAELGALDTALHETGIAVIHGLGGTGKSSVAREYAWQNRTRYGIVWWVAAETETGIIDGLLRLGAQLDHDIDQVADRHAAAHHVLANVLSASSSAALLVFDNVESEEMLRTWWPPDGIHLIITSRNAAWSSDTRRIHLRSWSREDAVRYLLEESGRHDIARADAAAVAEILGDLPLALAHAAAYLKRRKNVTAQAYVERVEHHLRSAPPGAEYRRAVVATFQAAIAEAECATPGAAAIACLAAFLAPDAIPEELFRQRARSYSKSLRPRLPDTDSPPLDLRSTVADGLRVDEAIGELDQLSIVTFTAETRTFAMHRLVQAAARGLVEHDTRAWIRMAVAVIDAAFPIAKFDTWSTCERQLPHALIALEWLPKTERFREASFLADKCARYFRTRASFAEAEALYRRALEIDEATFGPDHPNVASALNNLAVLLDERHGVHESEPLRRRALAIAEKAHGPKHPQVATLLGNLARNLTATGRYEEAEPLIRRALEIDEERLGANDPIVGIRLSSLAELQHHTGKFDEAGRLLRRVLKIDEEKYGPDHPEVASDLQNLALVLYSAHELADAEKLARRALAIKEAIYGLKPHPTVASGLRVLVNILRETSRFDEAADLLRRALAIDVACLGPHHPQMSRDLKALANLLRTMGRNAEAEELEIRANEE